MKIDNQVVDFSMSPRKMARRVRENERHLVVLSQRLGSGDIDQDTFFKTRNEIQLDIDTDVAILQANGYTRKGGRRR